MAMIQGFNVFTVHGRYMNDDEYMIENCDLMRTTKTTKTTNENTHYIDENPRKNCKQQAELNENRPVTKENTAYCRITGTGLNGID